MFTIHKRGENMEAYKHQAEAPAHSAPHSVSAASAHSTHHTPADGNSVSVSVFEPSFSGALLPKVPQAQEAVLDSYKKLTLIY